MDTRESPAVRPRFARIAAAATSALVTLVAGLGAAGVLPTAEAGPTPAPSGQTARLSGLTGTGSMAVPDDRGPARSAEPSAPPSGGDSVAAAKEPLTLPARAGSGRRVVYDEGAQRVWLVNARERVVRTYLVSGSIYDNLDPDSYEVYSTSRHATGIDDSGSMEFFVRFATGERAAIGFHSIPVKDGRLVQSRAQLGTPTSHGCIRQKRADARALWDFAPVGTPVVVVDTTA